MAKKFTTEDIGRILERDKHARAALERLERAGLKRDRWLEGLLLSIANSPFRHDYLKRLRERARSSRKIFLVPLPEHARSGPGEYKALPEGTKWNERRLRALADKLTGVADQAELSLHDPRVMGSFWLDESLARFMEFPQLMREFAGALREVFSRPRLTVQMDARENTRWLLQLVKIHTGGCHYTEVADILRPIYTAAGMDPYSEGWPTAESLKMLARRANVRRKKFLDRCLKRLRPAPGRR